MPCRWVNLARHNTQASQKSWDDDCTLYGSLISCRPGKVFSSAQAKYAAVASCMMHLFTTSSSSSMLPVVEYYIVQWQPLKTLTIFRKHSYSTRAKIQCTEEKCRSSSDDDWIQCIRDSTVPSKSQGEQLMIGRRTRTSSNVAKPITAARWWQPWWRRLGNWHSQGSFACPPLLFGSHTPILIGGTKQVNNNDNPRFLYTILLC